MIRNQLLITMVPEVDADTRSHIAALASRHQSVVSVDVFDPEDYAARMITNKSRLAHELEGISTYVQRLIDRGHALEPDSDVIWKSIYDTVFSPDISVKVSQLCTELHTKFEWSDPDRDYKDDVMAFASALKEQAATIMKVHA